LLNRPAWAAKNTTTTTKKTSVFGRHQVFDEILELEERKRLKREEKARRRAEEKEKQKKDEKNVLDGQQDEPDNKKRRISKEPIDQDSESHSDNEKGPLSSQLEGVQSTPRKVTRNMPEDEKDLDPGLEDSPLQKRTEGSLSQKPIFIDLDRDECETVTVPQPTENVSQINPRPPDKEPNNEGSEPEPEESDDDEYVKSLKRKAREKLRLQREASDQQSPTATQPTPDLEDSDPFAPQKTQGIEDPLVSIWITSPIPNTTHLVATRRASQGLREVKDFWCARQKFDPAFSAKVFFTWRGTKLFNSSTMRTIIRQLKKEKGYDPDGEADPSKGKITVEAITEELFQERLKAKERKRAAEADSDNDDQAEGEAGDAAAPLAPPALAPQKVVIKLTCQGLEPLLLAVRPDTSVGKIMRAFQQERAVDAAKTCWLVFDGDRLEPELKVQEIGFEAMDEVEVHPR
jgi:hypothetical protein